MSLHPWNTKMHRCIICGRWFFTPTMCDECFHGTQPWRKKPRKNSRFREVVTDSRNVDELVDGRYRRIVTQK